MLPVDFIRAGRLAICVGAGEDISFDLALVQRHNMLVHILDPTPRAKAHVEAVFEGLEQAGKVSINNSSANFYDLSNVSPNSLHFHCLGLWNENKRMRFYTPRNPAHVSHSILNLQRTSEFFEADCVTPERFCRDQGIEEVEVMKLDVEGAEYAIIDTLVRSSIRPRVLCIEFDEGYNPRDSWFFRRIKKSVKRLQAIGYDLGHVDHWNLTFVRS